MKIDGPRSNSNLHRWAIAVLRCGVCVSVIWMGEVCGTKPKVRLASFRLAARQLFSCPVASFISLTHAPRHRSGFRATRYSRTSGSCSDGYIEPRPLASLYSYRWSHFGHDLSPLLPDARVLDFSPSCRW